MKTLRTREDLENLEQLALAPFAQHSADSGGRAVHESAHTLRTHYQRDRARVIHCKAFRRLEAKTQVFLSGTGDHLRNRLTHSMEVSNIGRSIGRSLGLNEDLIETIALAHDLGHTPGGHAGEDALAKLMDGHGGFDHNAQSVRIVEVLEQRNEDYPGLNLSLEVLEGLRKHDKQFRDPLNGEACPNPSLEAQLANLADEIAYYSHDLEDGLRAGLLHPYQLEELPIWHSTAGDLQLLGEHSPIGLSRVIRAIIDREVEDVVTQSTYLIREAKVSTASAVRRHSSRLIQYSSEMGAMNREMRRFLFKNLYHHPDVAADNHAGARSIEVVFQALLADPEKLSTKARERIACDGLHRAVCDYIAGMTDPYLAKLRAAVSG